MLDWARQKPGFGGHFSLLSCTPSLKIIIMFLIQRLVPLSKGKHSSQVKINGAKGSPESAVLTFKSIPYFGDLLSVIDTTHGDTGIYHQWQCTPQLTHLCVASKLKPSFPAMLVKGNRDRIQSYTSYFPICTTLIAHISSLHIKSTCSLKPSPLASLLFFLFYTFHFSILQTSTLNQRDDVKHKPYLLCSA